MNGFYCWLDNTSMKYSWNMALIQSMHKESSNCSKGMKASNNALEWTGGFNYFFKEEHSSKACQVKLLLCELVANLAYPHTLNVVEVPNTELWLATWRLISHYLRPDNAQNCQFHFKYYYENLSSVIQNTSLAQDGRVCQLCISFKQRVAYSLLFVPCLWVNSSPSN